MRTYRPRIPPLTDRLCWSAAYWCFFGTDERAPLIVLSRRQKAILVAVCDKTLAFYDRRDAIMAKGANLDPAQLAALQQMALRAHQVTEPAP